MQHVTISFNDAKGNPHSVDYVIGEAGHEKAFHALIRQLYSLGLPYQITEVNHAA